MIGSIRRLGEMSQRYLVNQGEAGISLSSISSVVTCKLSMVDRRGVIDAFTDKAYQIENGEVTDVQESRVVLAQ